MQAIAMYSLGEQQESKVLTKIDSSYKHDINITKENKNITLHEIYLLNKNNWLYKILQKDSFLVNSYHNYQVTKIGKEFNIIAKALDDTIEAIEYKNKQQFVLGVQWHPELLEDNNKIFQKFIKEAGKYYESKY